MWTSEHDSKNRHIIIWPQILVTFFAYIRSKLVFFGEQNELLYSIAKICQVSFLNLQYDVDFVAQMIL